MDLSIVIPVYNEETVVEKSVRETLHFFSQQPPSWELIIVNDGSTDATRKILSVLQQRDARVRVITFPENRGKGAAVREGLKNSTGDYMLFFDTDLSTPLSEFPKFWNKKDEHTVLIGSRTVKGADINKHQRWIREMAGKLGNLLTRLLLPLPYRDTQCGFKLYPGSFRSLLHLSKINGAVFDIEWLLIAQENGFTIQEIPVTWINHPSSRFGPSSYRLALKNLLIIAIARNFHRRAYHRV